MEWQGENKGPTTGNGVGASSWRFELEIFPSWLPCGHVFEPKLNAICEAFWGGNALSRAHRGVLVPTSSSSIHCHLPLSFSGFILEKNFLKEKHGKKTPLSTFHCNQLQHTRSACFKSCQTTFDSILFKSLLSHAGQLSCLDVTEVTWPNPGFSAADDAAARSVVFVFIQINTFTYLRKMSVYQTNSMYVKLYSTK